ERRAQPSHEAQLMPTLYVTSGDVHGTADTAPGDTVEKEPPGGNVEERCCDLAPRCEPRPIEVRQSEAPARVIRDACDDRQRRFGTSEVRGVDDEAVREPQQIPERARAERRRPSPPEEDREIGNEKR